MKLKLDQLTQQLQQGLAAVYLICGDEPLLIQEACDAVRNAAKQQGFTERHRFTVEPGFAWQQILACGQNLSLFSDKQCIDIHIPNGKPGEAGTKTLLKLLEDPHPDTCLLIHCGRLDASAQKAKWFKTVEKAGVVVTIWPLEARQLPQWLQQRARHYQLQLSAKALQLLAEQTQNNLLAAKQALDKLQLRYQQGAIDEEQVKEVINDQARFDIFDVTEIVLQGDIKKVHRSVLRLQQEGVEPPLILWALTREIRLLAQLAKARQQRQNLETIFQQQRVWGPRKISLKNACARLNTEQWLQLLNEALQIDKMIKGHAKGNLWEAILNLALAMSGTQLFV